MARYDWARFYFEADLERHPNRPESWRDLGLGWLSGYEGSLTRGIDALERYLALVPDDPEIRQRLARAHLQIGDTEAAQRALGDLGAPLLRARILLPSSPEQAREAILQALTPQALAETPDDFETHLRAAEIFENLGQNEEALAQAQRAAAVDPLSAELFYLQARVLRRLGRVAEANEALALYEILRQLPAPGVTATPRQELALLRQLEPRLPSKPPVFHRRLARLLLENGDFGALAPLIPAIAEDTNADAILVLAQTAHTQGQTTTARTLYERALVLEPDHPKALAQKALLAYETHAYEEAEQLLNRAMALDPWSAPLHHTNGLLALARDDQETAAVSLRTAVDLVPWLARYRLTLADVLLSQGERAAVERLLGETPAEDPEIDRYREKHAL